MSATLLTDVSNQIQKFWAPTFAKTLRESTLLAGLVNKEYQGELKAQGDTVYVSQISDVTGELKDVGVDADSFSPEKMSTSRISIQADKRAVASVEIEDLIGLQSQLGGQESSIRDNLMYAIEKQVNDYLATLVSPSASAPDHQLSSVTDFNAAQIGAVRTLAAQAKWRKDKPWYLLLDPTYYQDMLNATTMVSSDYVGDQATPAGQIVAQRYGFSILEDNSKATDTGLAFHPDFMHLVMQQQPRFKLSDLHSQNKFGYVLSVDMVFGAALGHDSDLLSISVAN